ncbi:MAG: HNH endonuclease [Actinobacteria bacterium]|nr:HNH endonuclease [Actinomycetota bacterium]
MRQCKTCRVDATNVWWNDRRANGGSHTPDEWSALCKEFGNQCLKCERDDVRLTKDHVIPVSKGGTNDIGNIQPLCQSCNASKKDKHIDYRPAYVKADPM